MICTASSKYGSIAILPLQSLHFHSAIHYSNPYCFHHVYSVTLLLLQHMSSVDPSDSHACVDFISKLDSNPFQLIKNALTKSSKIEFDQLRLIRSEEHTTELQSLMRIHYAAPWLNKKQQYATR